MGIHSTREPERTPEVIETSVVVPLFVDGIAGVEIDRHGIGRLALYTEQRTTGSAEMECVLATRLVIPRDVMVALGERLLAAVATPLAPAATVAAPRGLN